MKFFAILALAVTAAMAVPSDITLENRNAQCKPPQYACKPKNTGWLVCNVDGTWLDGGNCGPNTKCKSINNLPYCV